MCRCVALTHITCELPRLVYYSPLKVIALYTEGFNLRVLKRTSLTTRTAHGTRRPLFVRREGVSAWPSRGRAMGASWQYLDGCGVASSSLSATALLTLWREGTLDHTVRCGQRLAQTSGHCATR